MNFLAVRLFLLDTRWILYILCALMGEIRSVAEGLQVTNDYKTMQQIVTEKIRTAIVEGKFKPNERLNQADLAAKLNVSRIPTREALRTLEAEGLVTFYPHRGAIVSTMSPEEIEEVYEIRILLEVSAAQRAMKFVTPEQLRIVRGLQQKMVKTSDLDVWVDLNDKFHSAIYEPSGWTRLLGVIQTLRNLTTPYIRLYVSLHGDRDAANAEHCEIATALEERDAAAMRIMMRRHLWHTCQGIVSLLRKADTGESAAATVKAAKAAALR
jgi:DNA-binding GntR family transcriptional regulator